jgi:polyhydroxybutyrate depolymerase
MKRLLMVLVLGLLVFGGAAAQDEPAFRVSERRTLDVGGVERIYSVYTPENLDGPAPLVVALHGRFSSGKAFEAHTHLSERAEENGWIVAYPQAYQYSWEDGGRELGLPRLGDDPQDDLAFIDGMIAALSDEYEIESVALAGFDTGGSMVERLLCESEHQIASAMLVGTVAWSYNAGQCEGKTIETGMLLVYGAQDPVYTALGEELPDFPQPDGSLIRRMGYYETVEFWAAQAGCEETPEQHGLTTVFVDCAGDTTVAAMLMSDVSHEWPRAGAYAETGGVPSVHDGGTLLAALILDALPVEDAPAPDLTARPRTFISYVPTSYTGEEPTAAIVALHGRPDSGAGFATITDFTTVAEEEGFIVVFPDGLNKEWSYLGGIMRGEMFNRPDDVAFLSALVDDLALDLNIDLSRVYLTGFSNGGFMTYRMACNPEPNRFAAYGVAGALLYPEMELMCMAAPTRPMLVEHGTEDISISWDGITHMPEPGTLAVTRNVLQSVSFFAARNGCVAAGADRTDIPPSDDETSVVQFDFAECTSGKPVRFFAVMNGGHGWPGVDNLRREIAGKVNVDINLSRELWEFFRDHRLED